VLTPHSEALVSIEAGSANNVVHVKLSDRELFLILGKSTIGVLLG
jgi:hypothetical protein